MSNPSIQQSTNPRKLKGGSTSELTKFKALWRDTLSEESREHLRFLFVSQSTQAEIRTEIEQKYGISLHRDDQLNAFRDWEMEQRQRDLEAEQMQEDERRALAEHPDWTLDQAREDVLRKAMMRAGSRGDFELGFSAIREDRATKSAQFKGALESAKLELAREAEARQREEFKLSREKFEFEATSAALAKLPQLKAISGNSKLTEDQKLEQARLELFGVAPK